MGKAVRVVPNKGGRTGNWKVKGGPAGTKHSTHNSKSRAVKMAKRRARQRGVGAVIHQADGTVGYGYKCDTSGARNKMVKSS